MWDFVFLHPCNVYFLYPAAWLLYFLVGHDVLYF